MLETALKLRLVLSIKRALLGAIYSEIKAVSFSNDGLKKLTLIYHLDRKPVELDYESLSIVAAEVLADLDFQKVEEVCEFVSTPLSELTIENLVYLRVG